MTENFLKLNDDKSEFTVLGPKCLRDKVNIPHFCMENSSIVPALKLKISEICKSYSFHLRNIGLIRKYLTNDATEQLVHAFVTSRLDMGNSLLHGLPDLQINRLSRLQNIATRIITRTKPTEHITPVLRDLHWLPIKDKLSSKYLSIYVNKSTINMLSMYISKSSNSIQTRKAITIEQQNTFSLNRELQNPGDRVLFYVLHLAYGISFRNM